MRLSREALVAYQEFYDPEDLVKLGSSDSFPLRKVAKTIGLFPTLQILDRHLDEDLEVNFAFRSMLSDFFVEYVVTCGGDRFWAKTVLRPNMMEHVQASDMINYIQKESNSKAVLSKVDGFTEVIESIYQWGEFPWWKRFIGSGKDQLLIGLFNKYFVSLPD